MPSHSGHRLFILGGTATSAATRGASIACRPAGDGANDHALSTVAAPIFLDSSFSLLFKLPSRSVQSVKFTQKHLSLFFYKRLFHFLKTISFAHFQVEREEERGEKRLTRLPQVVVSFAHPPTHRPDRQQASNKPPPRAVYFHKKLKRMKYLKRCHEFIPVSN